MDLLLMTRANSALDLVVAVVIAIIAVSVCAIVALHALQSKVEEVQPDAGSDSFMQSWRRSQALMEAVAPPAPARRTSIDLLRRRNFGPSSSPSSGPSSGSFSQSTPEVQPCAPFTVATGPRSPDFMDAMELDTETVATMDRMMVNRILRSVRPEEVETQRLVLDSFNWDLEILMQTEIMTGFDED